MNQRTFVAGEKMHGLHRKATRKPDSPQEVSESTGAGFRPLFPLHCEGAHIGAGAPPSANDAVETAPNISSVASSRRAIFFTRTPLWKLFHLKNNLRD